MTLRDPLERFASLRPPDPSPADCEAAGVRVRARLALLERSRARIADAPGGRVASRRAIVAACVLAFLAGASVLERGTAPGERSADPGKDEAEAWDACVERALGGDPVARQRLLRGGAEARAALLGAGERTAGASLDLLAACGPLRGAGEVAEIAPLLEDARLRVFAARLLAQDPRPLGPQILGDWAAAHPDLAAPLVPALQRVAAQGRRESALCALLRAGAAGSGEAAAAALGIGGADVLLRWLEATPAEVLREPACRAALREAPASLRRLLLRRADRGEPRALAALSASGLAESVPLWAERAASGESQAAREAVRALGRCEGEDAHLALARALDGAAAPEAAEALRLLDSAAMDALAARARRRDPDAVPACRALAVRGGAGLGLLAELAGEARLRSPALAALAEADDAAASEVLVRLAWRDDALGREATRALGQRLRAGHPECAALLEQAARGPHPQAAEQALRQAAERGRDGTGDGARRPRPPRGGSPAF